MSFATLQARNILSDISSELCLFMSNTVDDIMDFFNFHVEYLTVANRFKHDMQRFFWLC